MTAHEAVPAPAVPAVIRPARFLIATWDGGGNTGPAYNLGSWLARHGHRVRMIGWGEMAPRAAAAGIEFTSYPSVPPWPAGLPHEKGWADRMEPALWGAQTQADVVAAATAFGADVLVVDCMLKAGFGAARELGLPSAALVHVLYSPFVHTWGDAVMQESVAGMLAQAGRVLVLTPPGFDEDTPLPANTVCTGPVCPPPGPPAPGLDLSFLTQPGEPWVLVSFGTTLQRQAQVLPPLLAALAALPVRVLLTLGGVIEPSQFAAPPDVVVRGYLPHHEVLPHMSAVITHAGLSTITASLAAGVPLVCVPQGREQPLNAARVAACGAGTVVLSDVPPGEIAVALARLLRDGGARAAAQRFAESIAALGAGDAAARQVEGLAPTGGAGLLAGAVPSGAPLPTPA